MDAADMDLEAVRRMRDGDADGLRDLMGRHKEPVFRFVHRSVGNAADAAEITQECFFKAFKAAASFRPRASVKSWLFSIALNLCRDHFRRQRKFSRNLPLEEEIDTRTPATEAGEQEGLAAIHHAIGQLPEKLKFPFIFCILEDHSYDACAEVLGTNRKTVETRIYRARQQLRRSLSS